MGTGGVPVPVVDDGAVALHAGQPGEGVQIGLADGGQLLDVLRGRVVNGESTVRAEHRGRLCAARLEARVTRQEADGRAQQEQRQVDRHEGHGAAAPGADRDLRPREHEGDDRARHEQLRDEPPRKVPPEGRVGAAELVERRLERAREGERHDAAGRRGERWRDGHPTAPVPVHPPHGSSTHRRVEPVTEEGGEAQVHDPEVPALQAGLAEQGDVPEEVPERGERTPTRGAGRVPPAASTAPSRRSRGSRLRPKVRVPRAKRATSGRSPT